MVGVAAFAAGGAQGSRRRPPGRDYRLTLYGAMARRRSSSSAWSVPLRRSGVEDDAAGPGPLHDVDRPVAGLGATDEVDLRGEVGTERDPSAAVDPGLAGVLMVAPAWSRPHQPVCGRALTRTHQHLCAVCSIRAPNCLSEGPLSATHRTT